MRYEHRYNRLLLMLAGELRRARIEEYLWLTQAIGKLLDEIYLKKFEKDETNGTK